MLSTLNLARGTFDRDEQTRLNSHRIEAARAQKNARFILVDEARVAVKGEGLAFLTREQARSFGAGQALYLGRAGGIFYFACDVRQVRDNQGKTVEPTTLTHEDINAISGVDDVVSLRYHAHLWPDLDTALAVCAVAALTWRREARFCTRCGGELDVRHSGWEKMCPHGHVSYPRTDPAVIMGIRDHEDRLLLGRNGVWGPGKYSVLAGFVEAGESLEGAVVREVYEETRIDVSEVTYFGSQPWPFPRSLMLAFTGRTQMSEEDISVDGKEMVHAHFFTRQEYAEALCRGEISMPTPTSVASAIIFAWLGEDPDILATLS